jgi:hypothetical protein
MSWTFQMNHPRWGENFASLLVQRLKQILPDNSLREILKGQEPEIRQEASLMLLQRFLQGNQHLHQAAEREDLADVANQLQKSIGAALRLGRLRILRSIHSQRKRFTEFEEEKHFAQSIHPSFHIHVGQLPYEAQRLLLLFLLEEGVMKRMISGSNAQIVQRMLDHGISQSCMAIELGVSRQAVNQRIRCVGEVVRESLEKTEFPIQLA